ncbi:hypothetical protein DICPUDRAFT_42958 [Dictyostelium purpureum]|uniref:U2A'/phosphoprotein 32 family A C-terminal domain-containing protein n=1 Tax=Dictyostelium purpureum TaxID=5786 RepID=F1A381_DICPU|nr:uncharacterized protein DICPUDRAFT_42958 [Dictyostelium purpureum]EGC29346.1 hypothetical protein DICPUDRAFT_42958 [Dictyostelium purpureum]|eukprot:XP_003294123.1 hypothetical protein DICPUDRAFT_42958 [Dictyostelium purpureum]
MKLTPETISSKIGRKIDINTIEEIELDSLGFTEVSSFSRLKALKKLDLSSNRFQLIRHIKGLFDLPVIEDLNLTSNPVTKQNNYRITVIKNLPTLLVLDGKEITVNERNQARDFDESAKDPLSRKTNSIEDDDSDNEVNTANSQQSTVNKTEAQVQQRDEDNEEEKAQSKKLDEDSLFGSKGPKKLVFEEDEEISLESISLSSLEKKKVEKKPQKTLIFDDDNEDDIFGNNKPSKTTATKKSNFDLDDDLFGDSSKDSKDNLSSDFDLGSYIQKNKNRGKSSLFD